MGLGLSIAKSWRAAARVLALVAAITVALGVHPPHAEAAAPHHHAVDHQAAGSHSHFGAICLQAALDATADQGNGAMTPGHTDCNPVFDPQPRAALLAAVAYAILSVAAPHDLPFRQLITSFDPPPPRRG